MEHAGADSEYSLYVDDEALDVFDFRSNDLVHPPDPLLLPYLKRTERLREAAAKRRIAENEKSEKIEKESETAAETKKILESLSVGKCLLFLLFIFGISNFSC